MPVKKVTKVTKGQDTTTIHSAFEWADGHLSPFCGAEGQVITAVEATPTTCGTCVENANRVGTRR